MRYETTEAVMRGIAKKMGVSFEDYRDHRAKGETRCFKCKQWFKKSSNKACADCYRVYSWEQAQKRKNRPETEETYEPEERCDEPQSPSKSAWKRPDFFPCTGRPGSEVKVDALAYRYANGLPLWHDDDAGNGKTERELAGNNPVIGEGYAPD